MPRQAGHKVIFEYDKVVIFAEFALELLKEPGLYPQPVRLA
jgi:hypothetical protein